jgi:hypothetical protein
MTRYAIKSDTNRSEFVDVLNETANGFMVRVTREKDGYEKTLDDFMSRELFDTCLNTGFFYEM